ncbi:MAG: aminotransferase class IV [Bacillota bacterium]|nr:aminotransferase class IV [Bacillota bacterium]
MIRIDQAVYAEKPLTVDEGFQFGRGVFETILVLDSPIFWTEHCRRLNRGLADLSVRSPVDADQLLQQILQLGIRHCVLKVMVSPENIVLLTRPLPVEASDPLQKLTLQLDPRSNDPRLLRNKTINYLPGLLAWQDAKSCGYDDTLFFSETRVIRECSRSNVFFICASRILTPDCSCGLLPGIVRQWVLDRYPVTPGIFQTSDILSADAVFVTNSVIGIRPISQIDNRSYIKTMHPLVAEISSNYQDQVQKQSIQS